MIGGILASLFGTGLLVAATPAVAAAPAAPLLDGAALGLVYEGLWRVIRG